MKSLPLIVWLVDGKGADVNGSTSWGSTPLKTAPSLIILTVLLDRGADPALTNSHGWTPLMPQSRYGPVENVAHLLQDPRVRATANLQNSLGYTALLQACDNGDETAATSIIHLLLQAAANPALTNKSGQAPLDFLRRYYPSRHAAIALLEQYPETQKDAEKASLLVKARRFAVLGRNTVAPSYLQDRMARRRPLPRVQLVPVTGGNTRTKERERRRRGLTAFLLGMEGGWENAGMPRDVFRVVLDLLMPSSDPLRRKNVGVAAVQHG